MNEVRHKLLPWSRMLEGNTTTVQPSRENTIRMALHIFCFFIFASFFNCLVCVIFVALTANTATYVILYSLL